MQVIDILARFVFLSALLSISNGKPLPNKVWFEPKVVKLDPSQLHQLQLITCHQTFDDCVKYKCNFRWRIENNIFKKDGNTDKYEIVNNDQSLLIKPPLSPKTHSTAFACVVEFNGKALGEAVSKIVFMKYENTSVKPTAASPNATPKRSLGEEIKIQLKDGKNVALFIILGILFFIMSIIWAIVLHCHLSGRESDGYHLISDGTKDTVKQKLRKLKAVSQKALKGIQLKQAPKRRPLTKDNIGDSDSESDSDDSDSDSSESEEDVENTVKEKSDGANRSNAPKQGQQKPRSNSVRPSTDNRKSSAVPSTRSQIPAVRSTRQPGKSRQQVSRSSSSRNPQRSPSTHRGT